MGAVLRSTLATIACEAAIIGVFERSLGDVLLLRHQPIRGLGLEGRDLFLCALVLAALIVGHETVV